MNEQRNTFISVAEQVAVLNTNAVETLTKLNDVVASTASSVQVNITNTDGSTSVYNFPTVNYLQKEIDILNNNYQRLFSLNDNSVHLFQGDSTKKLFVVDLNREPNAVGTLNTVSKFTPVSNWFFESQMNPLITVKIDLTSQIDMSCRKVLSRRYMVRFESINGVLTTQGQASLNDFNQEFKNKNNFELERFLSWHTNPVNIGVVDNLNPIYDDNYLNLTLMKLTISDIIQSIDRKLIQ